MIVRKHRMRRAVAGSASIALTLGLLSLSAPAFGAGQNEAVDNVTTDYLADSSDAQQRWLSVPHSRIVMNPFDSGGSGSELDQTAGPALPLHIGYYANDNAILRKNLLQTYATNGDPAAAETRSSEFSEPFDDLDGWTEKSVTASAENGSVSLQLDDGAEWGHIEREVTITDVSQGRYLTIDVGDVSEGMAWNVKLSIAGSSDDLPDLQADSPESGEATFDLGTAYDWDSGEKTVTLKLYAVNTDGEAGGSVSFRSLSLHDGVSLPWDDESVGVSDDFTGTDTWKTAENSGYSATYSTDGTQGSVHLGDNDFGAIERMVTVDIDATPLLSVNVAGTSGEWAIKVSEAGGDDITVQPDTSSTGVSTYDLAGVTGWTGEHTFAIKLFHVGAGGWTTLNHLAIHSGETWLTKANSTSNEWMPEALTSSGTYSDGDITVTDVFHDEDSFSRVAVATTEGAAFAGSYQGEATWDADGHVLTVVDEYHTYSIAFPDGFTPLFGGSIAELSMGTGSDEPAKVNGAWVSALPDGIDSAVLGIGFAVNDAAVTKDPIAASQERARAAAQDQASDRATWSSFWNSYIARVPQVQDFSIQRVDDGGVTADEMRHFWYKAWINLEMNVLPATPETGNDYAQLGTGKPSMWMNGTPGTKNVASWDSLLGMQQLVYTDPDAAWESFQGMMALVEDSPDATEPSLDEYGTLGELGGESLPSRKAQTAWVLYSVTGDKKKLESIYDDLALHLNWERYNMRWVLGQNNHFDERDSEFVTSLAFDLKYAIKIAQELGRDADIEGYRSVISDISAKYSEWFFPTVADQGGKVWDTVQKVYLDASRSEVPFGDDTEGKPFRNEDGQWVRPGWSFYTSTAFVMDELSEESMVKTMNRFLDDYDDDAQLAGLGDFAVKAPDLQLIAYGLLDMDAIEGSSADQLRDRAAVLINSMNRDIVRSGWFAEVYYAQGEPGDSVGARGVRPSLFGISNYIDFVMMANGVRTGEGDPTFVRLAGATGGVSGLTYHGETLNVDLDGDQVRVSGEAAAEVCDAVHIDEGETVTWEEDCGDEGSENPSDLPEDGDDSSGGTGADGSSGADDDASNDKGDASATDHSSALPRTGADIAGVVAAAVILIALGAAFALRRRRRTSVNSRG